MYIRILCLLLATLQLTPAILGCDYKLLGLEVNSYVRSMQSPNSVSVSVETIKNDLFFLSDEDKTSQKYKEEENFNQLCKTINLEIKNERFLDFFEKCKSIYHDTNNVVEKYATHMLLEAVRNKFLGQLEYFKKLDIFHESREATQRFSNISISHKGYAYWPQPSYIGTSTGSK